jgi:hypothetical protein
MTAAMAELLLPEELEVPEPPSAVEQEDIMIAKMTAVKILTLIFITIPFS